MSRRMAWVTRIAGLVGVSGVSYGFFLLVSTPNRSAAAPVRTTPVAAELRNLTELSDAFSTVAEGIKPSVVYITSKRPGQTETVAMEVPPEFRRFFGLPDTPGRGNGRRAPLLTASGSGFVVSDDGYILTNNHVVEGATQVRVRLLDRREFDAKVVGTDPATDVAVLKISADRLAPAPLGHSDNTRVGEWVLAVGNPFGENLTFTVTQGIISAKGRALDLPNRTARSIQDFLQTDAAINPGNSGGPLVNMRGEVIGINSAIASETGTYNGYGFAIPIDLARNVMDQLVRSGKVQRVALGILARDASAEDAAYAKLDRIGGVLVEDFAPNSPAKAAGIEPGDLIVAVDDQAVDYVAQLQERIGFKHPGDRVSVTVMRKGGRRVTLDVKLTQAQADASERPRTAAAPDRDDQDGEVSPLGASFAPTDDDTVRELELPPGVRGLMVTSIDDNGPLAERLAAPGQGPDIIEAVEGQTVTTVAQLRRQVEHLKPGDIVTLKVWNARARAGRIERVAIRSGR